MVESSNKVLKPNLHLRSTQRIATQLYALCYTLGSAGLARRYIFEAYKSMKTLLRGSVQNVLFETGCKDYPYSMTGTAFVFLFQQRLFALTAKHVVEPLGSPMCFTPTETVNDIMPIEDIFLPKGSDDEERYDFAIIEFDMCKLMNAKWLKYSFIDLEKMLNKRIKSTKGAKLVIFGVSQQESEIDYQNKRICTKRYDLEAEYLGEFENHPNLHIACVKPSQCLPEYIGFSGSPVFEVTDDSTGHEFLNYRGMVIRGTKSSRRLLFIDSDFIVLGLLSKPSPFNISEIS